MLTYAGIDEAGYGPFFGPLVVGRCVMQVPDGTLQSPISEPGFPTLWERLHDVIHPVLSKRGQKIVINDSKKVHNPASGYKHLENSILTVQGAMRHNERMIDLLCQEATANANHEKRTWEHWYRQYTDINLDQLLPWYSASGMHPWQPFPTHQEVDKLRIARSQLRKAFDRESVAVSGLFASCLFENDFNQQALKTRSKADISFQLVASHLAAIWKDHAHERPLVVVDRQSGRSYYRDLLRENFPGRQISILEEGDTQSTYQITEAGTKPIRRMSVRFEAKADIHHFPVCLASMIAKLTRELWMARFQNWFTEKCPDIKPTLGYGVDGKRFWQDIRARMQDLDIEMDQLKRRI